MRDLAAHSPPQNKHLRALINNCYSLANDPGAPASTIRNRLIASASQLEFYLKNIEQYSLMSRAVGDLMWELYMQKTNLEEQEKEITVPKLRLAYSRDGTDGTPPESKHWLKTKKPGDKFYVRDLETKSFIVTPWRLEEHLIKTAIITMLATDEKIPVDVEWFCNRFEQTEDI